MNSVISQEYEEGQEMLKKGELFIQGVWGESEASTNESVCTVLCC